MTHHPAKPLSRAHMPTGYDISFERYSQGRTVRIPHDLGLAQNLPGFEDTYRNIVDYIVRITHRIWEVREVEYIAKTYAPDCKVFDDYGLQGDNDIIIANTHATTSAFPDIVLDADEVIWAGDPEVGFHTSHRLMIQGTNTAPSSFGPETGKAINTLCIANCVAKENEIFSEHVLYNTTAMLESMGIDPWAEAERSAREPMQGWPRDTATWEALRAEARPAKAISLADPQTGFDPDRFTRQLHSAIWQNGDMTVLDFAHADEVPFHGTTHRACAGRLDYAAMVQELRSCLSDIAFQVDEVYWMGSDTDGYLISTRWSMDAVHAADGLLKSPTGAPLQIWGITQSEVKDGRVRKEWMLFNELDVMIQIAKVRMG